MKTLAVRHARRALRALLIPLPILASTAAAQDCVPPEVPVDPCVVGNWVGTTTLPEALERMMASFPDVVDSRFFGSGGIGISVLPDGFYIAYSYGVDGGATIDRETYTAELQAYAMNTMAYGYLTADAGVMSWCSDSGEVVGEMTLTTPSGSGTVPLPSGPPGGMADYMPNIDYTCGADWLVLGVQLTEPLGRIVHDLNRVSTEDIFPAIAEVLETRGE